MNGLSVATSGIFAGELPDIMSTWRPEKGRVFHIIKPGDAADAGTEDSFPRRLLARILDSESAAVTMGLTRRWYVSPGLDFR